MISDSPSTTAEEPGAHAGRACPSTQPGLVLLFSGGRAVLECFSLENGALEIGRSCWPDDTHLSRHQARVSFDGRQWTVVDHRSRNGTYLDGYRVPSQLTSRKGRVVRAGQSVFLLVNDIRAFDAGVSYREGMVVGSGLAQAWSDLVKAADTSVLHVTGASGTGKELFARAFHSLGPCPRGPFVAVSCAGVPSSWGEQLAIGVQQEGTLTATDRDSDDFSRAADGGTLFLDEIAELGIGAQTRLLQVLEAQAQPGSVGVRLCSATNQNLRRAVDDDRFRADLYYRIARPTVCLPSLRERAEEIPHHVEREIATIDRGLRPEASLIERCLLLEWAGNVRELLAEIRIAAARTMCAGRRGVDARDLDPDAGRPMGSMPGPSATNVEGPTSGEIENALRQANGNVSLAARALSVHRNQIRRWLAKQGRNAGQFSR